MHSRLRYLSLATTTVLLSLIPVTLLSYERCDC
jgi:hypothetical protein